MLVQILDFLFKTPEFESDLDYDNRELLIDKRWLETISRFDETIESPGESLYCIVLIRLLNNSILLDRLISTKKGNRFSVYSKKFFRSKKYKMWYNIGLPVLRLVGHLSPHKGDRPIITNIRHMYHGNEYPQKNTSRSFEPPTIFSFEQLLYIWIISFWYNGFNILEFLAQTIRYTDFLFSVKNLKRAIKFSEKKLGLKKGCLLKEWRLILRRCRQTDEKFSQNI